MNGLTNLQLKNYEIKNRMINDIKTDSKIYK